MTATWHIGNGIYARANTELACCSEGDPKRKHGDVRQLIVAGCGNIRGSLTSSTGESSGCMTGHTWSYLRGKSVGWVV
jgi:hypothetical protein